MSPLHKNPNHLQETAKIRPSYWRMIGGGSLSISILIHAVLLAIAVSWIFKAMPDPPPVVDFLPESGGGGQRGAEADITQKKRAVMVPVELTRVSAKGAVSSFTLPDPEENNTLSSVGTLGSSGLSGGLGGSGSGGGQGSGHGTGFGSGMSPGLSAGAAQMNPFGSMESGAAGLHGTYYDLKFNVARKQIKDRWEIPELCELYRKFFNGGWNERHFAKYYRAPQSLSATRIEIPAMPAEKAPTFFGAQETQFPAWCVLYKGLVSPPESGIYRFVCTSDDGMAVRFDRKQVMSQHYCLSRAGVEFPIQGLFAERMLPEEFIPHPKGYPACKGTLACGQWFTVKKGEWYACEIILMETGYGGGNSAVLLVQKKGEEDQPLKLFHFGKDAIPVPAGIGDTFNIPPYDTASPAWGVKRMTVDGI